MLKKSAFRLALTMGLSPLFSSILIQSRRAACVSRSKSAWGGDNSAEEAASLAEFQAFTASAAGDEEDTPPAQPFEIVVPEDALEITDGKLIVRTHPKFPQVIDYRLGEQAASGQVWRRDETGQD